MSTLDVISIKRISLKAPIRPKQSVWTCMSRQGSLYEHSTSTSTSCLDSHMTAGTKHDPYKWTCTVRDALDACMQGSRIAPFKDITGRSSACA